MSTDATQKTVHRLTDIDVEEVSIVDRAANMRKFLVVKSDVSEEKMTTKAGSEVVSDGKGGATAVKDPGAADAAAATESVAQMSEPKLQLSPEARGELTKRVATGLARLAELSKMLEGAEEVAGLVEIPAALNTKFVELLHGIAEGDVAKSETGDVKKSAVVLKGLAQFSGARVSQLQQARDAIDALLTSVTPKASEVAADAVVEPPAEVPAVADGDAIAKQVAAAVTAALAPIEAKVAKGLGSIASIVESQGTTIAKHAEIVGSIDRGRGTSRSAPADAGERAETKKSDGDDLDDGGWCFDMASPEKYSVSKANKA